MSKTFLKAACASLVFLACCLALTYGAAGSYAKRTRNHNASSGATAAPAKADAVSRARVEESFGKLPLQFEANAGQTDPRVKFVSRGRGYNLFLTPTEAVLALRANGSAEAEKSGRRTRGAAARPTAVLRMSLRGANASPAVEGSEPLSGRTNYFVGKRERWRSDVSTFARVKYSGVYPGIDMVYYGNQGRLEYDFVVAPGADPRSVRLAFDGADKVEVAANGELVIRVAGGEVRQPKPVVYQTLAGGERREVAGEYVLSGRREVGFRLGEYDTTAQLVIDPVLLYSTYVGGSGAESAKAVAFDSRGGVYVTGLTSSFDFPVTPGAAQTTRRPLTGTQIYYGDAFVMKLNPSGTAVEYATYIGGSVGGEIATGIDVDAQGNAYVAGNTGGGASASGYTNDFPTVNAFDPTPNSYDNSFLLKLNPTGSELLYSTYIASGWASSMVVDKATGEAYVVGGTGPDLPTTPGAFKTQIGSTETDGFLTKFSADGRSLVYSTYLGGNAAGNAPNDIAIDPAGNAYLVGETTSPNFPVTPNGAQTTCTGCDLRRSDGYLVKFNPTGSAVLYGTLIGGSSYETAGGVALDPQGNIYVAGGTSSGIYTARAFAVTPGALNNNLNGGGGYVIKYNPAGQVVYSAIYAQSGTSDIAVDAQGNAYVVGSVGTPYVFPLVEPFASFTGSGSHVFIAGLNPTGSALTFSTLFGKGHAYRVVADGSGNIYVAGESNIGELPLASPIKPATTGGSSVLDGFVAKVAVTGPASAAAHIYGQLVPTDNSSPEGILMKLTGSQTGLMKTDAQGRYSFAVRPGGTYTVEPVRADWNFSPRSQTFTNVTADTQAEVTYSAANIRPEARMVSPVAGATYTAPATVLLKVEASDADGTVQRVEFFNNDGGLLFADTEAPYEFEWKDVPASDTWAVSAMVYDNTPSSTFVQWVHFVVEPEGGAATPRFEFSSPTYAAGESAGTASVSVTRSGKTDIDASVKYQTSNHMANAGSDFTEASGTLNFAAGETTKTFNVSITNDSVYESDETLSLHLFGPSGSAVLGDRTLASLAITNDDAPPTLAVNDVTLAEGNSGTTAFTFTVTRTGQTEMPWSFAYATADGTARDDNPIEEDNDYRAAGGTVSLLPSEASKTLTVLVNGDTAGEVVENFFVNLSNPTGATIADAQGVGTINNDDAALPTPTPTPQSGGGPLDSSFGQGGRVSTPINPAAPNGQYNEAFNAVVQPDGKILAVGTGHLNDGAGSGPVLIRYLANGQLDASFGNQGRVRIFPSLLGNGGVTAALQPDGRIIVAGYYVNSGTMRTAWMLARLTPSGQLDASFGAGGQVITDVSAESDSPLALRLLPDGKFLVAGSSGDPDHSFALARYNADGSPDTTFAAGDKHIVVSPFFGPRGAVTEAVFLADGKVVAAGPVNSTATADDFGVARYNADGSRDTGFAAATTDFGRGLSETVGGLAAAPDGKLVVVGWVMLPAGEQGANPSSDFAVARYNQNGGLDSTFGTGGKVITDIVGGPDHARAVVVQSNGKVVAAGASAYQQGSVIDMTLARYNTDGSLDSSFGTGGKVRTDFAEVTGVTTQTGDTGFGAALQPDGRIVVVGHINVLPRQRDDFGVARYIGDTPVTVPPSPTPEGTLVNHALASNGGVAAASSSYSSNYPASSVINGDRRGMNWNSGGGWNDATSNAFPDWVEVSFPGWRSVSEVDVFTLQDSPASPSEPTASMTFTSYGVTDFRVLYWDGSAWAEVPGGVVTSNDKVWRKLTFAAVTTSKVRVVVTGALAGYGRLTEVEAWGVNGEATPPPPPSATVNHALASNGATATASSAYSSNYPASSVNNGDRRGLNWNSGGGWNDATANSYPDWVEVSFPGWRSVNEVDVFTLQDNPASPAEPTEATAFTKYGVTSFDVQYWDGAAWQTVSGGLVTGNDRVWRKVSFPAVTTSKVRVVMTGALAGYSRLTEVEAWGAAAAATPPPPPTAVNHALASNGATATASSSYSSNYPAASVINGDRKGLSWNNGGGWNDATGNAFPDWVEVSFAGEKTLTEVDVYTLQDNPGSPAEPTEAMTFTQYGVTAFEVQHWDGSSWQAIPGAAVTANDRVWRKFTFPALTTSKIRVVVTGALGGYSRVTEVEAY